MDRSEEIERIVEKVAATRKAGLEVDYAAIEREHAAQPDLTNDLGELQRIETARQQAEAQDPTGDTGKSANDALDDDLQFLRHALKGYDVLGRLHGGGQGVVYRAIQESTHRMVAIKLLLDGPLATERQRYRFAREVALVSRLRHPNIVTIYDSGLVRGRQFFVMEYVDGLPIDDYALLHGFSIDDVVRMFRLVCQAVSAAHQRGIIHRDLKPGNILVSPDGQPHILDFGLAKDLMSFEEGEAGAAVSAMGMVVGTLPYLNPEQAEGRHDEVDVRSDVYSLAVVLFELITGQFPYRTDEDRKTVLANIVSCEPKTLRKALAEHDSIANARTKAIGEDLQRVVAKALAKDKIDRYQAVAAFDEDLGRYLAGDAVEASAHSRFYLLRKTLRKYRVPVAVTAAFLLLLVTALVAVTILYQRADTAYQRADTIAKIYQIGFQMGGYVRLGSTDRDAGRIDQAIAMFEKTIELGKYIAKPGVIVLPHLYDARHRLAELFETSRTDEAIVHCEAAVEHTAELRRQEPNNPQWRRFSALSHELRGRMAMSQKQWERALNEYAIARSMYEALLAQHPENQSLKYDLAFALRLQGICSRKLRRYEESLEYYRSSLRTFEELHSLDPSNVDYEIQLTRTELWIVDWYLLQETAEHDRSAAEWLQRSDDRVRRLQESGRTQGHEREIEVLVKNVGAQERELRKHREARVDTSE